MDEPKLARCRELLAVPPGCGSDELERAFMKKNFTLIQNGSEAERENLRSAHGALAAHLREEFEKHRTTKLPPTRPAIPTVQAATVAITQPVLSPSETGAGIFPLLAFDNWRVNVLGPLLLLG